MVSRLPAQSSKCYEGEMSSSWSHRNAKQPRSFFEQFAPKINLGCQLLKTDANFSSRVMQISGVIWVGKN